MPDTSVTRIDALRTELHAVDLRLVRLETQSTQILDAIAELRKDLSDQGRTPAPVDRAGEAGLVVTPSGIAAIANGAWRIAKCILPALGAIGIGSGLDSALRHPEESPPIEDSP